MKRNAYVIVEPADGSPRVYGFDSYLTPWAGLRDVMDNLTEELEDGQSVTVTITLRLWTDEEHREYIEANEIEMGR